MRFRYCVLVTGILMSAATQAHAQRRFDNQTLENIRQRYADSPGNAGGNFGSRHRGHGWSGGRYGYGYGYGWQGTILNVGPILPYGGFYDPYGYYGLATPYGVYYDSWSNRAQYVLPPIYAPAELNYGPLAMERFLGLHREGQQAVAVAAAEAARPLVAPPPAVRKSNEAARERAETFIQRGDLLFGEGQFQPALQRYKSATEAAPDLATPYIRQGIALAATNRFDLAAKAFKIGASLAPDIRFDGFELDMIYGPGKEFTKKLHFEDVARAGLDQPENGNIMFVLGVLLFYDGQIDRSEKFFRRAADLDSTLNDTVRRFTGEPIKGEVRT